MKLNSQRWAWNPLVEEDNFSFVVPLVEDDMATFFVGENGERRKSCDNLILEVEALGSFFFKLWRLIVFVGNYRFNKFRLLN